MLYIQKYFVVLIHVYQDHDFITFNTRSDLAHKLHIWLQVQGVLLAELRDDSHHYFYCAEDGAYNAVWDEKTMLCYSLLQCKCSKQVGVSIHSTSHDGTMQSLVGKVSCDL